MDGVKSANFANRNMFCFITSTSKRQDGPQRSQENKYGKLIRVYCYGFKSARKKGGECGWGGVC